MPADRAGMAGGKEKGMKRRLFALFGIFALCMSLLTVDAAAAEGETVPEEAVPAS